MIYRAVLRWDLNIHFLIWSRSPLLSQKIVNFYFLWERKLIMLNAFASLKHSKNTSIRNDLSHGKLLPSLVVLSNPPKCNYVYVPGKMLRTFRVVDVERTSKKCAKTCNAPAELFFSSVNQFVCWRPRYCNARSPADQAENSQCMGQASNRTVGNTLLIRTASVVVMVSGWLTFSIPNLALLTPLIWAEHPRI